MNYQLSNATPSDENWLESLRRSVYQELFNATWGAWDEGRHARHFAECLDQGHISIIKVDGVRTGMVQIFENSEAVEIGEIQVQPSDQNRGIGTCVLEGAIRDAHQHGKSVRLSLGLKNSGAYRLYVRLGFYVISQSETHFHMECSP